MIYLFSEIQNDTPAGGKARSLALMEQKGIPVPVGLVITSQAFSGDNLSREAKALLPVKLNELGLKKNDLLAVRSSAEAEDSSSHSFAGEFESLLNVSRENLLPSIEEVYASRLNDRVDAYQKNHNLDEPGAMSVVLQKMIRPRYAGVIFSADPVTGRYEKMIGNAVKGLGEDLVSGEADSLDFTLARDTGRYDGPVELKKAAKALFEQLHGIEKIFACPMDVEWGWDGRKMHILQARPVSTLSSVDKSTGGQNDSLTACMLWSNANVAEAVPDVMTPATWSVLKVFHESGPIPFVRIVPSAANIAGRPYINVSYMVSIYKALGKDYKETGKDEFFGNLPENLEIPLLPQRKKDLLPKIIKAQFTSIPAYKKMQKDIPAYLEDNPQKIEEIKLKISRAGEPEELITLWEKEIFPHFVLSCKFLRIATILFGDKLSVLRGKIKDIVGAEVTNDILSNLGGSASSLVSLNLVRGVYNIQKGKMSREDFLEDAGFRGPHEFELSIADMQEDPSLLEDYLSSPLERDPEALLSEQKERSGAAWTILEKEDGKKAEKYRKELKHISFMADRREKVRAEMIRVIRMLRNYYLKTGRVLNLGEDVFFLSYRELMEVLVSQKADKKLLAERKKAHEIYSTVPYYPALIKGSFDPIEWWNDPARRMDIADSVVESLADEKTDLKGQAASCGSVEGIVRVITDPSRAKELQEGEILVAATTNVGWTPYFLKAAGVITDVGAPLSHAAIVARELGIPAIVGCGHATTSLKTGDRIVMNGGDGTIAVLEEVR